MARHNGWLELGFERTFFLNELTARGFQIAEHRAPDLGAHGTMIVATAPSIFSVVMGKRRVVPRGNPGF